MTIQWWHVYLIGQIDFVATVFRLLAWVALFIPAIVALVYCAALDGVRMDSEQARQYIASAKSWIKKPIYVLPLVLLVYFIPSSKTLAAMILIPPVVNNERIHDVTGKGMDLIESKFDEWLKDMADTKETPTE